MHILPGCRVTFFLSPFPSFILPPLHIPVPAVSSGPWPGALALMYGEMGVVMGCGVCGKVGIDSAVSVQIRFRFPHEGQDVLIRNNIVCAN